ASGFGGVLGSVCAPWVSSPSKSSMMLFQMVAWAGSLTFLAIWGWRSSFSLAIVMATLSFTGALGNIEVSTYLMCYVDANMLARVTSISQLISFTAFAVGPMLGAVLIQLYGAQNAIFV